MKIQSIYKKRTSDLWNSSYAGRIPNKVALTLIKVISRNDGNLQYQLLHLQNRNYGNALIELEMNF